MGLTHGATLTGWTDASEQEGAAVSDVARLEARADQRQQIAEALRKRAKLIREKHRGVVGFALSVELDEIAYLLEATGWPEKR